VREMTSWVCDQGVSDRTGQPKQGGAAGKGPLCQRCRSQLGSGTGTAGRCAARLKSPLGPNSLVKFEEGP